MVVSVKQGGGKGRDGGGGVKVSAGSKEVDKKARKGGVKSDKPLSEKNSTIAGWLQDLSVEAPVAADVMDFKPGEREVEFSVAMRERKEQGAAFSELRGRALVHAHGQVLVLAEASYVAEKPENMKEAELVRHMYLRLRPALQQALELAGHKPPLPESLEEATA